MITFAVVFLLVAIIFAIVPVDLLPLVFYIGYVWLTALGGYVLIHFITKYW